MRKPKTRTVFYMITVLYGNTTASARDEITTVLRGRALYEEIRYVCFTMVHPEASPTAVTTFYYIEEVP